MNLTDSEKKILKSFALYIQSYGSTIATTDFEVSYGGDTDFWSYGWNGNETRITIETYDSIDNLIEKIITETDLIDEYFDDDTRGQIIVIVNAIEKSIKFRVSQYHLSEDKVGGMIEKDELPENILKWMQETRENESYTHGQIHYEGSGDSGYIESDMTVNGKHTSDYPSFLESYLLEIITDYGDWYNNEGGQGEVYINFIDETIEIDGGVNYEDESNHDVPLVIHF